MRANYHTHTPRCHHAEGEERAYVMRAIEAGFSELGFSDHTPYLFDGDYRSRIRMDPEDLADYVSVLEALRLEYRDRISLRIGLETEYYPKLFPRLMSFLRDYPIEYMILGQHALCNEQDGEWTGRPTTEERKLDQYCGQTMEALETGLFTYFAHPDLFNFVGEAALYDRYMRRLCRKAKDCGVPLEINLLGLWEEKQYPNPIFWRIAAEEGCTAVLGSDAHAPEDVWVPDLIARGEALAREAGIRLQEVETLRPIR